MNQSFYAYFFPRPIVFTNILINTTLAIPKGVPMTVANEKNKTPMPEPERRVVRYNY